LRCHKPQAVSYKQAGNDWLEACGYGLMAILNYMKTWLTKNEDFSNKKILVLCMRMNNMN
jgi:hypothetical protein